MAVAVELHGACIEITGSLRPHLDGVFACIAAQQRERDTEVTHTLKRVIKAAELRVISPRIHRQGAVPPTSSAARKSSAQVTAVERAITA